MKTLMLLFTVGFLLGHSGFAQNVGINNTDPKAALDINGGLRLRQQSINVTGTTVQLASNRTNHLLTGSPTGDFDITFSGTIEMGQHLIITNSTSFNGLLPQITIAPNITAEFTYSGINWQLIGSNEVISAWGLIGNANTDSTINYLGTSNTQDLILKRNNQEKLRLVQEGLRIKEGNTLEFGAGTPGKQTDNGKIGYNAFGEANTLSIVGAGIEANGSDRKVKVWANGGTAFTGGATFNGNIGVGNITPTQRLEVTGKIKIGNDGVVPSAGAIRYNADLQDFEGYNGTEWQSFTKPVNTEYWGSLNRVLIEIKPSNSIDVGTAQPKYIFSDNYLAVSHQSDPTSTTVTRFYKWEAGNWVYKTQVNADIIHQTSGSFITRGRMTDDWLLYGNQSANSVSIYRRNGELWQFHSTIAQPSLQGFGDYYDIDGNRMVISTIGPLPGNNGQLLVYNFNGTGWVLQQTINDPTPATNNDFGTNVSLKNNFLAASYGNNSTLNTTRIFNFNGASFVWNSSITGRQLGKIFFEGASVRIEVREIDFVNENGGIYKIGTSGLWELIPNTFGIDPIPGYGLIRTNEGVYTLRKLESGIYKDLCVIDYATIPGAENNRYPLLNKNSIILPSTTGYKIFKKL